MCVEVRGQAGGIGSPLPPCGFCCSNTGHWPWPQAHLTIFAGPKLKNYEFILTNKWLDEQMNGEEHICRKITNVSYWAFLPQGQGLAINAQLWVACTLWFLLRNMVQKGWSGEKRVTFGRNQQRPPQKRLQSGGERPCLLFAICEDKLLLCSLPSEA